MEALELSAIKNLIRLHFFFFHHFHRAEGEKYNNLHHVVAVRGASFQLERFQPNINCHFSDVDSIFYNLILLLLHYASTFGAIFARVLTKMASFIMLIVVKRTKIEKINVHIGSKIFHSGWKYITSAVRKTPHD